MSIKKRIFLLSAVLSVFLTASCATPAYKQNKYKRAKRYNDCGCLNYDTTGTPDLCYYEEK